MPNIGPLELVVILVVVLLLFGAKRLPELGKSLGSGMREFKDAVTGHSTPEPQPELPPAEPTVAATTATPSEHETTP